MAHFRKAFPSKFLSSSDLDDGPLDVTIKEVPTENLGTAENPELKLVAHFEEDAKPCVLNITRAESIADITGDEDTDSWVGKRVRLRKGSTRYQGKRVACIEVSQSPAADGESVSEAVGF